ncbi:hypothetical protein STCU_11590 [Strigomonas culicis]|uniref:Uncharacterized protein n=1 Tax=Strigomonas culicis TaxID=28005 RepID=S9UZT5_9TRYP|nr:hypothetical protein STCU_11590 [Strigomonas culicis]|eukprot:EPY16035.1 hypothetical protein STCU_11590 [Strigomonas culicis]
MDAIHEAHLARILENRRRRGVLLVHPPAAGSQRPSRGPSTGTQTEGIRVLGTGTSPVPTSRAAQTASFGADSRHAMNETDNDFAHSRDAGAGGEPEAAAGGGGARAAPGGADGRPSLWRSSTTEEAPGPRRSVSTGSARHRSRRLLFTGRPITEFGVLYASPDVVPRLRFSPARARRSLERLPTAGGYAAPLRWSPPRASWSSPRRSSPSRWSAGAPYDWRAPARSWRSSGFAPEAPSAAPPRASSPENVQWTDHAERPEGRGARRHSRRHEPLSLPSSLPLHSSQSRRQRSLSSSRRRSARREGPHDDPYGPPARSAHPSRPPSST